MATTTISLERSAYELLKSRKKPEESFSQEIARLLGGTQPRLSEFATLFSPEEHRVIADAVEAIRAQELGEARRRLKPRRGHRGHRA